MPRSVPKDSGCLRNVLNTRSAGLVRDLRPFPAFTRRVWARRKALRTVCAHAELALEGGQKKLYHENICKILQSRLSNH